MDLTEYRTPCQYPGCKVPPEYHSHCRYPDCEKISEHHHHILGRESPNSPIAMLCRPHHEEITMLNGIQARKYHRGLTERWRWRIWYRWLAGEMKPRRTKRALEYIKSWDDYKNPPVPEAPVLDPKPMELEPLPDLTPEPEPP